jgi:hypothetical protein
MGRNKAIYFGVEPMVPRHKDPDSEARAGPSRGVGHEQNRPRAQPTPPRCVASPTTPPRARVLRGKAHLTVSPRRQRSASKGLSPCQNPSLDLDFPDLSASNFNWLEDPGQLGLTFSMQVGLGYNVGMQSEDSGHGQHYAVDHHHHRAAHFWWWLVRPRTLVLNTAVASAQRGLSASSTMRSPSSGVTECESRRDQFDLRTIADP